MLGTGQVRAVEHRQAGRADALADALALRLAAIEAADTVFRISHQLHGAMGFCDESTLSWISRYSQPLRRLPWGVAGHPRSADARRRTIGIAGLFVRFSCYFGAFRLTTTGFPSA